MSKIKSTIKADRPKMPTWIRVRIRGGESRNKISGILRDLRLNTICQSAGCPNLAECWHKQTATFMILGDTCTRNCRFCAVKHSEIPLPPPDSDEAANVAEAAGRMGLRYVVVTSVTRDDLPDGGAQQFADIIRALRKRIPDVKVEVLTPDFKGRLKDLKTVLNAGPAVFNHNMETVERLSSKIRSGADYRRSLKVLKNAVKESGGKIPVKSGLMVGLGETDDEVEKTIYDIRETGALLLTIGQYLPPTPEHWPLHRYVKPSTFSRWKEFGENLGFAHVASAPLVRSSYNAEFLGKKLY